MAEVKKQERDFSPEVDTLIPEATALCKVRFFGRVLRTTLVSWGLVGEAV